MYKCNDCGATFYEPAEVIERHGLDCPPYERWSVCPYCGDTNFDEYTEEEEDEEE